VKLNCLVKTVYIGNDAFINDYLSLAKDQNFENSNSYKVEIIEKVKL
jgi:hypothetical protein